MQFERIQLKSAQTNLESQVTSHHSAKLELETKHKIVEEQASQVLYQLYEQLVNNFGISHSMQIDIFAHYVFYIVLEEPPWEPFKVPHCPR